jgi:hypothetical protein
VKRPPEVLTDDMTSGAEGFDPERLTGRAVVAVQEISDSDRGEFALLLDNGRVCLVSCDPVRHAEDGTWLPENRWGERWEVVLYDATDTQAGKVLKR